MDTKEKTKKELIHILQKNNHPNSVHLAKFTKTQLQELVKDSSLKTLPPEVCLMMNDIEKKEEVIQNICKILLPKK